MFKKIATILTLLLISGCSNILGSENTSALVESVSDITQVTEEPEQEENQVTVTTDQQAPTPNDPFYAPIEPSPTAEPIHITGSLFDARTSRSLYSYVAPFVIGDTITILLKENASASKSASSTLGRKTNFNLDPIQVPGGPLTINEKVLELGIEQDQGFDGSADAQQQHSLSARITVSVVDILNNGNLVVRGEKWLVINNGKEYMRFTGIVRPLDVSEDNSINSYQVADSRIEFSGTGDHANTQTQGWLSSFLGSGKWPF